MAKKAGKIKISKVKQKNILGGKKTKGKKTGSQSVVKARRKLVAIRRLKEKNRILKAHGKVPEHEEATAQDVLDMLDSEELSFIRGADHIRNQYLLPAPAENGCKKERKRKTVENDNLESQYESKYAKEMGQKKSVRVLLPIKTKGGLTMQTAYDEDIPLPKTAFENSATNCKLSKGNKKGEEVDEEKDESGKVISTAMLLARRKDKLAEYKMKIGILAASFLEDPENRLRNVDSLLAMLQTNESAVSFTVPKLSAISLVMVFQDVLPAYAIKHHNAEGVKLKKDTRELQGGEANLLRRYKTFLQRIEKIVTKYLPRQKPKGMSSSSTETETKLGRVALDCMCKMLISHPYFNLATNIINLIIPFLNHWDELARKIVFASIKSVFRIDKRGEISYEIVRRINIFVKSKLSGGKSGYIRRDVIDVLLALRIKEVDLEKEKGEEMKPKGKMTFEERRMLSKRSRKKAKDMVQLERELLETAAEENKSKKSHFLTEITKLVFTMYFRALKTNPNSAMLSAVLEGLAKFAHIINIDFFDDLLKVLGDLQRSGDLKRRQSILCIATVLAVLDGQGQALTLDPTLFHKNLYGILIQLKCGRPETDVGIALRCIRLACGRRKIPGPRATAFVKRLAGVILQLEYNDALGALMELKNVLKMHPVTHGLLDSDGSLGSGVYLPELDNPDHCGAQSTTLWEMTTLMSHYHPWVPQVTRGIVHPDKVDDLPKDIFSKPPEEITKRLDPYEEMNFQPELDPPTPTTPKPTKRHFEFLPRTDSFKEILPAQRIEEACYDRHLESVNFVTKSTS